MNVGIKKLASYLMIWAVVTCSSCNCNSLPLHDECIGIVVKKFRNPDDHLAYTIWVEGKYGKQDIRNIITDDRDSLYLYHKINLGDSIIKNKGIKAYHVKGHNTDYFYERQCN